LEELEGAGLMSEMTGPSRHLVVFSHSLIQRAIYDDLGPVARRELHAKAAALSEGSSRLFHRASAASGPDETLAADLEAAGAEAEENYAPAQAVAWLTSSAEVSPFAADRERRLFNAFRIAIDAGDTVTAGQLKLRLDEFDPTPRLVARQGHYALITGQFALAEQLLQEAWRTTESPEDANFGAQGASSLAMYLLLVGRSSEAVTWGQRALSKVGGDDALARHIRNFLSMNLVMTGQGPEGLALLGGVPAAAADIPRNQTSSLVFRGAARLFLDDISGARRDFTAASARHRSGLSFSFDTHGLTYLVDAEYRAGAWDEASVHADFAVTLVHDADRVWDFGFVHAHAALVPAGRGEWVEANAHIEEAWGWAEGFGVGLALAMVVTAKALMLTAQQDWAGVLAAVDTIRSFGQLESLGRPGVHNWRPLEVEAFIALGQLNEAARALEELERAIPASGLLSGEVSCWHLQGLLADARGRSADANDAYATARRLAGALQIPFQVALLELDDGRHATKHGRLDEARTALHSAHQRLRSLKAQPYIALCESALRDAGERADPSEAGPILRLTPTELVVARLVSKGMSNRDVAAELYVSVKAIEFHLSNIFDKLGIRSRREIIGFLGVDPAHG
jgi:ATP/maltotriose-dependent transcriptional regulator MalT